MMPSCCPPLAYSTEPRFKGFHIRLNTQVLIHVLKRAELFGGFHGVAGQKTGIALRRINILFNQIANGGMIGNILFPASGFLLNFTFSKMHLVRR